MAPRWLPLESNPDVMNDYIKNLGVRNTEYKFFDVYGLDADLLAMVPQPVVALLLLFPITENYTTFCREEETRLGKDGDKEIEKVYFTKQTVGNACGTVGILHSILNNIDTIGLKEDSPLQAFYNLTKDMTPDDKAAALETDDTIAGCHEESAVQGQTQAVDEKVDLHFVAIVHKNSIVYELDGRKPFPINHGSTSAATFLSDAAAVCKKFMDRDPNNVQFNIVALAKED